MAGNPRENASKKGFWDGGSRKHGSSASESGGRSRGFPGGRKPKTVGVRTDLEEPPEHIRKSGE